MPNKYMKNNLFSLKAEQMQTKYVYCIGEFEKN